MSPPCPRCGKPMLGDEPFGHCVECELAILERLGARYARADDEVREDLDEGQRIARSELAGLLEG